MSVSTPTTDDLADWYTDLTWTRAALYALVLLGVVFFLAPLETGLMTAFKSNAAVIRTLPFLPPFGDGFTLDNAQFAWNHLSGPLLNSLVMSIPATLFTVLFASMAAYGLTMVDWRGQLAVLSLFLVGVFVPYQAVLVPLARFWNNILPLGKMVAPYVAALPYFTENHAVLVPLIITHVAYGIPIITVLFRSYMQTLPTSLVESAMIDGASVTKIYYRIIVPLCKPMFAVVFIYQFTQIYNEFLFSLTLIGNASSSAATVTLVLPSLGASVSGMDFGVRMSASLLAAIPTLIIYVAFAEQFAKGLATEA
ncbi:carbohydrate ABC transporter permease [Halarchaeum nitratireducens]|uniref:Sugar ABC transporter permease n=1 Tax=Halarchaeum nitratireducens TaxID=489913 RepID=A0A830GD42_9EURY|nr:carbohydrate ABC transporter permease [Halarchaeum nitratireducens]GGN20341.1 sugar ABC transporter permease [Halarchaeum nitratireducens]